MKNVLAVAAVAAVFASGCGGGPGTAPRSRSVTVKGSDTMVILGQRWAETYMKEHPGVSIQVTGGGSGTGIAALINGATDICEASRPMKDKEKEMVRSRHGRDVKEIPVALDGFFLEAHMKLRPVDFASEGFFLCGACHGPKFIDESIAQAQAAAARAVSILSRPLLEVGGVVSRVDPDRCAACLTCVRTCPYGVPRINADGVAEIEAAMCHGCGVCAAECPAKAIDLMHYKDRQIVAKTDALFAEGGVAAPA